jgi:hypothetical protein
MVSSDFGNNLVIIAGNAQGQYREAGTGVDSDPGFCAALGAGGAGTCRNSIELFVPVSIRRKLS